MNGTCSLVSQGGLFVCLMRRIGRIFSQILYNIASALLD